MRIYLTEHAVLRYIERHAPGMPYELARAKLDEALPAAVRMRERTHDGADMYRLYDPFVTLAVRAERDGTLIVVTTLPRDGEDELPLQSGVREVRLAETRAALEVERARVQALGRHLAVLASECRGGGLVSVAEQIEEIAAEAVV